MQRARQLELRRILFVFAPAAPLTHSKNLYYFHIPYPSAPVTAEPLPPTPLPPFAASDFGYTLDIYLAKVDKSVRIWCGKEREGGTPPPPHQLFDDARVPRPHQRGLRRVPRGSGLTKRPPCLGIYYLSVGPSERGERRVCVALSARTVPSTRAILQQTCPISHAAPARGLVELALVGEIHHAPRGPVAGEDAISTIALITLFVKTVSMSGGRM